MEPKLQWNEQSQTVSGYLGLGEDFEPAVQKFVDAVKKMMDDGMGKEELTKGVVFKKIIELSDSPEELAFASYTSDEWMMRAVFGEQDSPMAELLKALSGIECDCPDCQSDGEHDEE